MNALLDCTARQLADRDVAAFVVDEVADLLICGRRQALACAGRRQP
jgi:hypothetical protein